MGDLAAVAFVLVLIIGITLAGIAYHNRQITKRQTRRASTQISVYCEREGEHPLLIGSACTSDDDFSLKIELLRSTAHQSVAALGHNWKIVEHSSTPRLN